MSTATLITAILLGAIGSALVVAFAVFAFQTAAKSFLGARGRAAYRRAAAGLRRADALIEADRFAEAMGELQRAIVFDEVSDRQLIALLNDHHQNVLSRFLLIAEENALHLENIALLERLFLERAELQSLRAKALDAYRRLQSKRVQAGKDIPVWGKADFETRSQEIATELRRNQEELLQELGHLAEAVKSPRSGEQITYH